MEYEPVLALGLNIQGCSSFDENPSAGFSMDAMDDSGSDSRLVRY
jgi:hypothetical protein